MKAINIIWDVDDEEEVDQDFLPTEIEIPWYLEDDEEAISDYITDLTGFCHKGFQLEEEESSYKCPLGEDETNDCLDCTYGDDHHFVDGECVERSKSR